MTFKEYVEIFNSLLTPLIAILAAYIAWQQYKVSHSSLNNQLYERRFKVFKAVMSYLADIMREGNTNIQRTSQFYAEASEADFLFDEKISLKITELYEKGIDLAEIRNDLYPIDGSPGLPKGEERSKKAKASGELMKWFYSQIKETKDMFKQHMQIK
jgi:hypothetical protein